MNNLNCKRRKGLPKHAKFQIVIHEFPFSIGKSGSIEIFNKFQYKI